MNMYFWGFTDSYLTTTSMMAGNQHIRSHCPHVTTVGGNSWEEVQLVKQVSIVHGAH